MLSRICKGLGHPLRSLSLLPPFPCLGEACARRASRSRLLRQGPKSQPRKSYPGHGTNRHNPGSRRSPGRSYTGACECSIPSALSPTSPLQERHDYVVEQTMVLNANPCPREPLCRGDVRRRNCRKKGFCALTSSRVQVQVHWKCELNTLFAISSVHTASHLFPT